MDYRTWNLTVYEKIIFRLSVVVVGIGVGWIFYGNVLPGIVIGIILTASEKKYKEFLITKRKEQLLAQFKDLLYSLSSAVSTGRSLGQAIEESIKFWEGTYDESDYIIKELMLMSKKMRESNISDIDAFKDFAERSDLDDIRDFMTVCKTCKSTGADFASAIDKGSEIIENKIDIERELKSITAQKRFEGKIVALAPIVIILAIKLMSPSYMMPLYDTGIGKIISTISLVLTASGFIAIERVNRIEI